MPPSESDYSIFYVRLCTDCTYEPRNERNERVMCAPRTIESTVDRPINFPVSTSSSTTRTTLKVETNVRSNYTSTDTRLISANTNSRLAKMGKALQLALHPEELKAAIQLYVFQFIAG